MFCQLNLIHMFSPLQKLSSPFTFSIHICNYCMESVVFPHWICNVIPNESPHIASASWLSQPLLLPRKSQTSVARRQFMAAARGQYTALSSRVCCWARCRRSQTLESRELAPWTKEKLLYLILNLSFL